MKNVFNENDKNQIIERINLLNPESKGLWGKMNVAQMLAHCNVTYEMVYTDKHPKPNFLVKKMLQWFVKNKVVTETPYSKNGQTAPAFIIKDEKKFNEEKQRLVDFIIQTQTLGAAHFDGKESHSFGNLSATEWNNMFYKHLDHHLSQFGV
jgi:Protein of unknown function (DUF1569)